MVKDDGTNDSGKFVWKPGTLGPKPTGRRRGTGGKGGNDGYEFI